MVYASQACALYCNNINAIQGLQLLIKIDL